MILTSHLDDDLLDEANGQLVRPPGPVLAAGLRGVVDPDLGVSAVHGDGQQGVARPEDPGEREHQHHHGLEDLILRFLDISIFVIYMRGAEESMSVELLRDPLRHKGRGRASVLVGLMVLDAGGGRGHDCC